MPLWYAVHAATGAARVHFNPLLWVIRLIAHWQWWPVSQIRSTENGDQTSYIFQMNSMPMSQKILLIILSLLNRTEGCSKSMLRLQPVALSFPNAAVIEKAKCHTYSLKTGPQMNLNLVADVKLYVKLRRRRGSAVAHHQTFFVFLKYLYDCSSLDVPVCFLFWVKLSIWSCNQTWATTAIYVH